MRSPRRPARHRLTVGLLTAALLAPCAVPVAHADVPEWRPGFSDDFDIDVPRGAFSDCDHHTDTPQAYCDGLTGDMRDDWWAYPEGWPDTATQRGLPVGGRYDPDTTLSVSHGKLHIRLWRGLTGGVHSATLVPKKLMGRQYGWYEERWRVAHVSPGYKSAHLLWPVVRDGCSEIDFPELEWDSTVSGFVHPSTCGRQFTVDTGEPWTRWHTTVIEWRPGDLRFHLDGELVGHTTEGVPARPMTWDIQNESALNGEQAAPGSWAQLDIDYVRGGAW
ncbi:glycoside hydrolase family 16 protein [Streptomyces sp. ISL-11]|uniref:glycoside hydrolase family 16 protein n=1 Tax=Streptomyces sp. ISL-11 TaxID=2819174 RepID=UPI001BECB918|nr:glycoside hydrolase family 16 protein [Streptomyces sp. ISL-11]MBT2386375.1 glycoside hydrolase family 16 protein [Streptomyces sp. ISL-11]